MTPPEDPQANDLQQAGPEGPSALEERHGSAGQFEPLSLEWHDNGELAGNEVFELVKRLRAVESGDNLNELWRLSQRS